LILKSVALGGERRPALEVATWENDKGMYAKQDGVPKGLEGVCIPSTRPPDRPSRHHDGLDQPRQLRELSIERRFLLAIQELKAHDAKSPAGALPTGAGG